ncbi:hypothetical protein GALMADRAFT_1209145 [Galerina marginata CBS 339.88]|uniref:Uncharacterized protein n=1 Tax=Galerina marginata (strain CBS 339.88) TaxID=685588 RepID=A0A067SEE7_GALM3|nr:hypothetical protein GALMADRAFT_1209145 [Galerina marginata CBS 339.88]
MRVDVSSPYRPVVRMRSFQTEEGCIAEAAAGRGDVHSRGRGLLLEKPIRAKEGVNLRSRTRRYGYGVNETRPICPAMRQREEAKSAGPGLEVFID